MEFFGDWTLRVVALGAGLLGAVSGFLGSFAVLRRQSLLGDALSHAALPGIALAFLITGGKATVPILIGAAVTGWVGTLVVRLIVRRSRVPYDAALGLVLSVFFGLGLVLLTVIQKRPDAAQAGLETYLFGQAAALLRADVIVMAVVATVVLLVLMLAWKEMKVLTFDRAYGESLGLPMGRLDGLVTALLVVTIVLGLQTVGVVLMSAMIVAPGAAARQWTRSLGSMVTVAAGIGVAAGVSGAVLSSLFPRLPTGPTIVLILSALVAVSLLMAPGRGLVWRRLQLGRLRGRPRQEPVLMHLHALSLQHPDDPEHGHEVSVLRTMSPPDTDVDAALTALAERGLAASDSKGLWAPTEMGRREAQRTLERLDRGDKR
ncbi:MAG: metal ABC transporter permease [Acidobacteria bacterium]|nr:MAG: metal ABC transporter permease [Acidobacteriota bacterium]